MHACDLKFDNYDILLSLGELFNGEKLFKKIQDLFYYLVPESAWFDSNQVVRFFSVMKIIFFWL